MKKNKLLKMIGCIALVATPVIVTPIVMLTSCTTTDPINPGIEVTSIQGIKLMQGEKSIIDKSNSSGTATYKTAEVENMRATAAIDLIIEIYFYINNDPTPVRFSTIKSEEIILDFVCSVSSNSVVDNIFRIKDNNIVISNEEVTKSFNSSSPAFCYFAPSDIDPKGYFGIRKISSVLTLSYNMKGASDVNVSHIDFAEI